MADTMAPIDPRMTRLQLNKESGYNYRERRHDDWDENYTLYRDKVQINRLIQRQSVNLPLMKQTIRTLLKDVDDMPVLYFENLDNDKDAEIFKNAYWEHIADINNLELQDIVDKRQVMLFGRSFDQWQIVDGKVKITVQDPMDIIVDRYCDPFNIHSSRFLIHTHIFVPLSTLEATEDYDQAAIAELKKFYATEAGLLKNASNQQMLIEKNQKLADMGLQDVDHPVLGETIVELSLHFVFEKRGDEPDQIYLYVEADDQQILMDKALEDVIGETSDHFWRNHYPYESWADDLERQDFWSDSIADIMRNPCKVLNAWYSQEVERRTIANYGMHYYDATAPGASEFHPNSFNPTPWGWYGVPGKPGEVLQKIDIPLNDGNMEAMTFLIAMAEKASGATATQQGAQTERQVTLGEVKLALGEAKERIKGMSKFYTPAWKRRGLMFTKLVEAAGDKLDAVTMYKKGRNTDNIYSREIAPKDWQTKSGYRCKVWSQDEKQAQDTEALNKLNAAKTIMPDNPKLDEVYKRKVVEFADLQPDEINEIMAFEQEKRNQLAAMAQMGGQGLLTGGPAVGEVINKPTPVIEGQTV